MVSGGSIGNLGGIPRTQVTTVQYDRCANLVCTNRVGEGQFGIITIENVPGKRKPVTLALCSPCVEVIQEACRG